jgi:thiosulfate dehydrogenase [quinone] large subunit
VPFIGSVMRASIAPNRSWFPYLIVFAQFAVGIDLTLGLLTPVALIAGIFLNIN